jgi:nucleoside-diphosphate-sugar epimerase
MDQKLPGIIVTGASGFIGRHFLEAVSGKYRLFCLARRSPAEVGIAEDKNLRWTQVDIGSWDPLREVVRCIKSHGGADYLLHLAGYYDFSNEPNPEYQRTNVDGTRNMLKLAKLIGVKRFIFSSSLAACEFPDPGEALNEKSSPDANFPYAWSKRECEELILESKEWFPSAIIRLAAVYSDWCEYPPVYMFLNNWLSKSWNSRILGGKGESAVPYIHINDLIDFILKTIEKNADLPRLCILNASPNNTTSHLDLYQSSTRYYFGQNIKPIKVPRWIALPGMFFRQWFGKLIGKPPFERVWMAKYIDQKLTVSADYTQNILDWKTTPRYDIKRRLLFLIENMKNHRSVWDLRNEAALKRIARRPNMVIYQVLYENADQLREQIYNEFTLLENKPKYDHYQQMDENVLRWYIMLIFHLIITAIRTGDRTLFRAYIQTIAYRRYIEEFTLREVEDALRGIGRVLDEFLQKEAQVAEFKDRIYDYIHLTIQLAIDEMEDSYEYLDTQPPAVLKKFADISLPTESVDLERIVHQLQDICENGLEEKLSRQIREYRNGAK